MRRPIGHAIACLAALLAASVTDPASAMRRREAKQMEMVETRPVGAPLMAIVSLGNQRITIYDADGWVLRAPVSSGQPGFETPAGIYSVIQKEEEHYSNLYDDASMPFMQRITWSGIALHGGLLPGYPASHGCVRLPHEFARRLFDMTKIGMRVIVAPDDVRPAEITHPALFKPKLVRAGIPLEALTAHWDMTRADEQAATLGAAPPGPDPPSPANPREQMVPLKLAAAAKLEEANAEAKKAEPARLTAAQMTMDAARLVRIAEVAKYRAEAQLRGAEERLAAARPLAAVQQAEAAKSEALAKLAGAEARLIAAKAEEPAMADAAARAREEARVAEVKKIAALKASDEIKRVMAPVSIFISRETQRLYVRQGFQQVLEVPVVIRDAFDPIGTHIYTALDNQNGGAGLRWSTVSMEKPAVMEEDMSMEENTDGDEPVPKRKPRHGGGHDTGPIPPDAGPARAALDRIEIPKDIAGRISEVISPGSSLIISDEAMSAETGKETDFVILMSGEPQGGIKKRRRHPEARYDDDYDRSFRRSRRVYPPSYDSYDSFVPW